MADSSIDYNALDAAIGQAGPTVGPPLAPNTVLDNTQLSYLDLPGQLDSIPGGTAANGAYPGGAADPSGINSLYLAPTVNPTPTGGYMPIAASIASAAATGFSTFAKGSPSVATPPPRLPSSTLSGPRLTGTTNWLMIGFVVAVGIGVMAYLAKTA
jgi:hypothetical protein